MRLSNCVMLLMTIALASHVYAEQGKLRVASDKENVVASRLAGSWQVDDTLNERLTGSGQTRLKTITFKSDPVIAEMLPDKYVTIFKEREMTVFMAGTMVFNDQKLPFVLTAIHGNPHVMFWLEQNGDRFGNGESFNIMLAPAKDQQNDLLFVGGDFNNQPFSALHRAGKQDE